MNYGDDKVLRKLSNLHVYSRGARRAPHKPLLVLLALGALVKGRSKLTFEEVNERLAPLLRSFAPPVQGKVQPELPYWYLASDSIWEVEGAAEMPLTKAKFPRMEALKRSSAFFTADVCRYFEANPESVPIAVELILEDHFSSSIQDDILAAVGLELPAAAQVNEMLLAAPNRTRDPKFREEVLRAYEHRCAASGFRAALGGSYFGCEAAHVRWHACDGPDKVENGMTLEPTLHKLFDAGAWSLTDERRIIVSRELTGTDAAIGRIRDLHGKPLREPLPGEPRIDVTYIRWHREKNEGGVFRAPALPL